MQMIEINNMILVGKKFLVEDLNGREILYEIVLPEHENKSKNKMSCSGPYGKAFLNKTIGDLVCIGLGSSRREVSILNIT